MNVKLITKALHTLSLLSEEDYDLVLKLRALTEDERGMLMLVLEPSKPAGKKASKRSSKSAQLSSSSKSPRATGIEQQLSKRRGQGRVGTTTGDDESDDGFCRYRHNAGNGHVCGLQQDHNIHHLDTMVDHHPFQPPVPTAPTRSPANSGAESTTANSEIAKDAASNVHHAGG